MTGRVAHLHSGRPMRWGIVGTGRMAGTMAEELRGLAGAGALLVAVCSRDASRGRDFAARHGIVRYHASVEALAADAEVDAVYVASPPAAHATQCITLLEQGKGVLCEKPFAIDEREARQVIGVARARGVFLMEALWTRFLPAVVALRDLIASGRIGTPQLLVSGGAFVPGSDAPGYLFNPALGGGVLHDAGVYLVSLAAYLLGEPTRVIGSASFGPSGVDETDALVCEHGPEAKSLLYVSLRARRAPDLELLCTGGRVLLGAPVFRPTRLTVIETGCEPAVIDYPIDGSGYGYQVRAMMAAMRRGETESTAMPLAGTLAVARAMDACAPTRP